MKRWQPSIMILLAMFLTQTAQAHTFGAHDAGFAAGLAHPFIGLDHLLAMVAVGVCIMLGRGILANWVRLMGGGIAAAGLVLWVGV